MAKQTFTTGQVLTAAQMTSLQQTAMGGGAATAKTANYVLVAADAGTTVAMNAAGATTITVNTGLFAAGDTVLIQNLGAGTCTVTAGTATVSTAGSLALVQYESGILYFTATGAAIFNDYVQAGGGGGGKVLQVVTATNTTQTTLNTTTFTDTNLTATITPTLSTSKILVLTTQSVRSKRGAADTAGDIRLMRGGTAIYTFDGRNGLAFDVASGASTNIRVITTITYLDSPATTSATTYKTQGAVSEAAGTSELIFQNNSIPGSIILLEIGA
jgi:hypothetical protein